MCLLQPFGIGRLIEPLTDRAWEPSEILVRYQARVADFARRGLGPRDRVFLHHGNTLEFFVDLLAVWHLGACAIPVNSQLSPFELTVLAEAARPKLSLWHEASTQEVRRALSSFGIVILDAEDRSIASNSLGALPPSLLTLDEDALILFTSGTTGSPKGVVHTHRSLRARWMSLRSSLGTEKFRRTMCLLPTHFGHGLICNSLFPWLFGQDLYVLPAFRANLLVSLGALIDQHEITSLSSVPTVWRLALKTARPPEKGSLRRVFCGSAPLSESLWRSVQEWTRTAEVVNAYGITETGSWLAGTTMENFKPEDGLVGEAWGGVLAVLPTGDTTSSPLCADACKANEPGFIWVNTPGLMKGYLGRNDLTSEVVTEGWFSTGDIGVIDDRGCLYLRGRVREEINKGGQKIYPGDVDAVIEQFEDAIDVCTFGFTDPLHGEDVGVAVVPRSSAEETLLRLHRWTSAHLAPHQMPQRWYVITEIPRNSRGKVNRGEIATLCADITPVPFARLLRGENPNER